MMESAGPGEPGLRAFLRVGGMTLARHQLAIALKMGCQRIVCIAREITQDLIALQHEAERAAARFHVITGARGLPPLVTAHDELLVLGDGLLAAPESAIPLLEGSQCVLVQPVESGVAAGFERIDLNHAAAGAMRIPGRFAERLSELPSDCDVSSALMRIALQEGVAQREVPAAAREGVRWRLVRSEAEAQAAEDEWIRLYLGESSANGPAGLLARVGVLLFGPSLLHAGAGTKLASLATVAVLALALGVGWLGSVVVGLFLCALGWIMRRIVDMLGRIEAGSWGVAPHMALGGMLSWLVDLVIVLLVSWRGPLMPWESTADRAFAPLVLVLVIRLAGRLLERTWADWLQDRMLLALLLAVFAWVGVLIEAVQLLTLAIALAGIVLPGRRFQLTRT